jgi:hypothetical protein
MEKEIVIENYDQVLKWSYSLAKKWVEENLLPIGIDSVRKFEAYKRAGNYLPSKFPRKPSDHFKRKGTWKGWVDFFSNPDHTHNFMSFEDAKKLVGKYGIKNSMHYRYWKERPAKMPARPERHYPEWKGWEDFLGRNYDVNHIRNKKLKESDVRIIKHQLDLGVPGAVLARTFNVSEMQISRIKKGENWNHI